MRCFTVPVLVPGVLALFAVADVAGRLVPLELLAFRPWEVAVDGHLLGAPFRPDLRVEFAQACGDLAPMGNLRGQAEPRRERFTTDARGFRNAPRAEGPRADGPPDVLLVGDSFAAGAGLSDEETLGAALERRSGRRVHDAAGTAPLETDDLLALARGLGMTRGLVIEELYERNRVPRPSRASSAQRWLDLQAQALGVRALPCSRVTVLATRLQRWLRDGRLLPNEQAGTVTVGTLLDGSPMLFLSLEAQERRPEPALPYFGERARALRAAGLELLVVLVPKKVRVHGALLREPDPAWAAPSPYLTGIAAELRPAGIPVLDLTAPLQAAAREALAAGQRIWWRDDSHWNPRGAAVAADAIAGALP